MPQDPTAYQDDPIINDDDIPQPISGSNNRGSTNSLKHIQKIISRILYVLTGVVICAILVVIVVMLVIINRPRTKKNEKIFSFDDIFNSNFLPTQTSFEWLDSVNGDSVLYWKGDQKECAIFRANTGDFSASQTNSIDSLFSPKSILPRKSNIFQHDSSFLKSPPLKNLGAQETLVVPHETLVEKKIACYSSFQTNGRYFAFKMDAQHVFRHSTKGFFAIYDSTSKKLFDLNSEMRQIYMLFSPQNENVILYIGADNNIYKYDIDTSKTTTITTDGAPGVIFNGVSDWLYEEDVWAQVELSALNQDGSRFAFLRLNDTFVPTYTFPTYEQASPYPKLNPIPYPTAGQPIPIVSVRVHNMETNEQVEVFPIDNLEPSYFVYDIKWISSKRLLISFVTRVQNTQRVYMYDADSGETRLIYEFKVGSEKNPLSWIEYPRSIRVVDENTFVQIKPSNDYYHIQLVNVITHETQFLTSGEFNVVDIFPQTSPESVYYLSTQNSDGDGSSTEQYLYRINLNTKESIIIQKETESGFFDASISPSQQNLLLYYSGPGVPKTHLVKNIANQPSEFEFIELDDNENLERTLQQYQMPEVEVTQVTLSTHDTPVDVMFIRPPGFDKNMRYPTLLYMYGGPGSKLVDQQFTSMHNLFSHYMASQGVIVVTCDNIGTGRKSASFMQATYKRLGVLESKDQVALKEYLSNLRYVDSDNIGIWGWSFGGYNSIKTSIDETFKKTKPFKVTVAVAPVTDWIYYNAAYTERYMEVPPHEGYEESSIVRHIVKSSLNGTHFLLNHGNADDNVHPLNSFNLISQLQENEIQFNLMTYPNKDHSISGSHTRRFLWKKLSTFFVDQFGLNDE